jgi:SAM-dependent methyltransferase
MQRAYHQILFIILIINVLCSCQRDRAATPDGPSLLRESPKTATTVSEPIPLPKTGAGNFESLVADYESKDRGIWQKPELVISLLGNLEGKTVADIGASTGYFSFRMLPKAEKVIGIEIDQRFINFMDSVKVRLPEKYRTRFETRLARPEDPLLKPDEADAVVIVNTYAYIDNRVKYLKTLAKGMRTDGKLLIIDFKKNNLPIGPPEKFKVSSRQVEQELSDAGFVVTKLDNDVLDYQYVVLAKAKK